MCWMVVGPHAAGWGMNPLLLSGAVGAGVLLLAAASPASPPPAAPPAGRVGRYWTWEELTVSPTARQLGLDNTPPPWVRHNLAWIVHHVLDPLRARYGRNAVRVNSGYRSPAVNRAVGGVANSLHQAGLAFDLAGTVFSRPELTQALQRAGLTVVRYPSHTHIEVHASQP